MKLVVGLGNPGSEYEATKHNLGFWVLDAFANKHQLSFSGKRGEAQTSRGVLDAPSGNIKFLLAKPQTYMNLSGRSVQTLLHYYKISLSDLLLIYDDLDLDIGRLRIKKQGGAGGHRGVSSVISSVGSNQFVRLKIGIGENPRRDAADYVLSPFRKENKDKVLSAVDDAVKALPFLLDDKIVEAMNRFNES